MAVHQRGWIDTNERIGEVLQADEFLTKLVFRHLNLEEITQATTETLSASATIFCHARYPAHNKPLRSKEYIESLVIGELMAPVVPTIMSLPQEEARKEFEDVMDYLIDNPTLHNRNRGYQTWTDELHAANAEIEEGQRVIIPARDEMDVDDYASYLIWLAIRLQTNMYMNPIQLIVSTYVGVAKRGTLSDRYVDKVVNGVRDDLGVSIDLDLETIKMAYNNFGRHITAANAEGVFDRWLRALPEHALRLRLSLEQVAGSGLTAYVIIGRAMRRYRDFPWDRLNTLLSGEVDRYLAAVGTVNGNAYYGFNRDLGVAKSTLFSSVAYTAKELLIKIAGETTLTKYQGWIKRPKSPAAVESLISDYVTHAEAHLIAAANEPADAATLQRYMDIVTHEIHNNMFA